MVKFFSSGFIIPFNIKVEELNSENPLDIYEVGSLFETLRSFKNMKSVDLFFLDTVDFSLASLGEDRGWGSLSVTFKDGQKSQNCDRFYKNIFGWQSSLRSFTVNDPSFVTFMSTSGFPSHPNLTELHIGYLKLNEKWKLHLISIVKGLKFPFLKKLTVALPESEDNHEVRNFLSTICADKKSDLTIFIISI